MTGLGYDSQLTERDLFNKSDVFESAFDSSVNESKDDNNQANDRYKAGEGYHGVPPPYARNFMPSRPDLSFTGLDDSVFKSAICEPITSVHETETSTSKTSKESMKKPKTVRPSASIIEDWESNSDDDCKIRPSIEQNKPSHAKINFVKSDENTRKSVIEQHTHKQADNLGKSQNSRVDKRDWNGMMTQKLENDFEFKKKACFGNPQYTLKDQGIFDSGCSRHMMENKSLLIIKRLMEDLLHLEEVLKEVKFHEKTECHVFSPDFKLPDENQVLLKVPRQNNMYSFDLKNVVPTRDLTCLFTKTTIDESNLWHRRLSHIIFKAMNKLVRGNLVKGLPLKIFKNDHTCVACQKGKQHKASCKPKLVSYISQPLEMLHMDLFGLIFVKSLNNKMYCLVVTDDFSGFSWVFFLAFKDETNGILKSFITRIENQINHKVKIIKCDNETKFKNSKMNQFFQMKGIKREFSVARTPQQNRVAERKNRTLIEAVRTMLTDLLLPTTFLAEAVSTACYVKNRVLVIKPHNKTPYELLIGKFEGKADEGFLVGYSVNRKARQEKASDHEYILFPFTPSSTQSSDDKDAGDVPDKGDEGVSTGSGIDDQKNIDSSTQDVSTNINACCLNINIVGPSDHSTLSLEETDIFDDVYDDREVGAEADTYNLELLTVVSPIPTTRVHKGHPKEQITRDLNLAT
nr:hypothetical protein [Tanacetum cinerariifolium]